jgi:hypothetical protein
MHQHLAHAVTACAAADSGTNSSEVVLFFFDFSFETPCVQFILQGTTWRYGRTFVA